MTDTKKQPAVIKADITKQVLDKVKLFTDTGEMQLPSDYSPANALKSAMLILEETEDRNKGKALVVCSQNSIAQALLKMVIEGLSPLKKQGYFIVYGKELQWSRSYQGSIALAKRVGGVKQVVANVIYKGDTFEFAVRVETGHKHIIKHEQSLESIDNTKIVGAYAVVIYENHTELEVMTITEIRAAWNQGAQKGASPAHKNFTQEMCKKTVINRACKTPINSSSDVTLINGKEDDDTKQIDSEAVKSEVDIDTAAESVEFEEVKEEGDPNGEPEEKTESEKKDEAGF